MENIRISAVVPVYNEAAIFGMFHQRLKGVLESITEDFEILYVDDGSTDRTEELIRAETVLDRRSKFIGFSRNFGHQVAVSAGLDFAEGDAVIVLDADLQDPPEVILPMVEKWREGWDVVYGVREGRKEGIFLRACFFLFYRLLQKMATIQIPPDSGDFCLMSRRVVDVLKSIPERNRFVRGIRAWVGFRQIALPYERGARFSDKSKYSLRKLIHLAIDGLTSFSQFPLRVCGYLGYGMAFVSVIGFCYGLISKFFFSAPMGWASIIVALFFIGGIQLIMLSVVGSYIGRIYTEVQHRPLYVVKEFGNIEKKAR